MENQKTKIISVASIISLALTLVTATFAYFMAQTGEGKSTDIKINANTVDTFTFETGSALNINLNQDNFANGAGNQTGTTYAKAMLTANNKTNTATEHYYLYLNITENTFTYTQDENTPEILLTIKDASGNAVTSISGLTYKTIKDGKGASISGFDITTKKGLVTLFNNREITTTSTKTEEWNITITFVNYNANQAENAGKSFSAKLLIQKEKMPIVLSDVCTSGNNLASCVTTLANKSDPSIVNIYHHDGTIENGIDDNSYRFAGASDKVNNFVCFGSTTSPCPTDNLYRIIGVMDGKVKLIKYDYATSVLLGINGDYANDTEPVTLYYKGELLTISNYYWNYKAINSGSNMWSTSLLNKINLNTNYVNNIGVEWANKIATTTWKVGGNTFINVIQVIPSTTYQNELKLPATTTTYEAKIGLMYVSDYGFAVNPNEWDRIMNFYNEITNYNWMYMGAWEWTITPVSNNSNYAFNLLNGGNMNNYLVDTFRGIRPVFFLNSSVTYSSGTGTSSDPIIIN